MRRLLISLAVLSSLTLGGCNSSSVDSEPMPEPLPPIEVPVEPTPDPIVPVEPEPVEPKPIEPPIDCTDNCDVYLNPIDVIVQPIDGEFRIDPIDVVIDPITGEPLDYCTEFGIGCDIYLEPIEVIVEPIQPPFTVDPIEEVIFPR